MLLPQKHVLPDFGLNGIVRLAYCHSNVIVARVLVFSNTVQSELRDLPDAALGYFITKAFPTMGRSEEEAVRTTSRTLHVVRHMQTLVFHEWMERKDPLPRFTGPDGSAAIFVVKATRRKEWLQKLFGSVSGDP